MPKEMVQPDAQLDGLEFSAITRLIEALHMRKEAGVDQKALDSAVVAKDALGKGALVGTEDLKNLLEAAKEYKELCEQDKLEQFPNVKGPELDRIVKKLEGMVEAGQTEDDDGNKVHPASLPPGEEPERPKQEEPAQNVRIVETPDTKKEKDDELKKAQKPKLKKDVEI